MPVSLQRPPHLRTALFFLAGLLVVGLAAYDLIRREGGAEDLSSFQPVEVCRTDRDFNASKKSCPRQPRYVTTCDEAKAAIKSVPSLILASEMTILEQGTEPDCSLKTVNAEEGLYAWTVKAYYATPSNQTGLTASDTVRSQAIEQLYRAYGNLYQSYVDFDLSTTIASPGILETATHQAFVPGFLIKGEPGFRMHVSLESEAGAVPGAATLIRVSCGTASDTMTAEPNGNSWFSYEGYERLECGAKPLTAEVIVERDRNGRWISGTPSYNYLYEPDQPVTLSVQNRPQTTQASFTGRWQGLGATVRTSYVNLDGTTAIEPLADVGVDFTCELNATPSGGNPVFQRRTDGQGNARISLAEALQSVPSCDSESFVARLSTQHSHQNATIQPDASQESFFPDAVSVPVNRINGLANATGSAGLIEGKKLMVGGYVALADVGAIQGGRLTALSRLCFFYSQAAAEATPGCPEDLAGQGKSFVSNGDGSFLTPVHYGNYKAAGEPGLLRVVNYRNEAYPNETVENNGQPLTSDGLNLRTATLPTNQESLRNHVCLSVTSIWPDEKQCEPVLTIIFRESTWNVAAVNKSSGACGLFQANPCSKYGQTALPGESSTAIGNQIRWGINYIKQRYGSPQGAWAFWQKNKWY